MLPGGRAGRGETGGGRKAPITAVFCYGGGAGKTLMVGLFSSAERDWVFGHRDQDQDGQIPSLNIKAGIKTLRNTILYFTLLY